MKVVALISSMMDRSRFDGLSAEVVFVRTAPQLLSASQTADIVVADLSIEGAASALGEIEVKTIGYASHVERDQIAGAKLAGVDEVMPRSKFFSRLPTLFS